MTQNGAMDANEGPQSTPPPLVTLLGRPFGTDEQGNPIDHGSGKLILGSIEWMKEWIAAKATSAAPAGTTPEQLAEMTARAQQDGIDRLVQMLNAAIPDPRFRITQEYLRNESNLYSYEFRLFVSDYCRQISGDEEFFFHAGARSIPRSLSLLGRPLGIQRTWALLPRFISKLVKTDMRVVSSGPTSAVIQWHGRDQIELVPPPHRLHYIRYACATYRGGLCAIPQTVFGLPMAEAYEVSCQASGAECCEWQFSWKPAPPSADRRTLVLGFAGSAILAGAALTGTSGAQALLFVGAAAPMGIAWHAHSTRRLASQRDNFERQLLDERDLAEQEYDHGETANASLQRANVELVQRLAELTALHESALGLGSTLDVGEVLNVSLRAIVDKLGYDRALVLLANTELGVLEGREAVGVTAEMAALIRSLQLPYADTGSPLVQAFVGDGPMRFEDIDQSPDEAVREFARALGATAFIATPLVSKGNRVGVLAVDNGLTGRPLDAHADSLLMTLARQIAAAVETARLHEHVEAQNRTLEERVAARTAELELAKTELERELTERLRLRERELQYLDQVNRIVAAATAVEKETFEAASLEETASRDDELGQLARTFTRMATSMVAREHRLLNEVRELRIEIDSKRQAQQVADIVGSEYFQSLRSQARDLRKIISNR